MNLVYKKNIRPKYPDPSKVAILRVEETPAIQVQTHPLEGAMILIGMGTYGNFSIWTEKCIKIMIRYVEQHILYSLQALELHCYSHCFLFFTTMPYGFHSFIPENEQLEDDSENKLTFFFFFGSLYGPPFSLV